MGRRLISVLALTVAVGSVVRLAPAQDDAALPPPAEALPAAPPLAAPAELPPPRETGLCR